MILAVISDTHGKTEKIYQELKLLKPDHLLFAGDYYADGKTLAQSLEIPFDGVRGNCDSRGAGQSEKLINLTGKRIFMVHGHQYGVKRDMNRIYYRAKELDVDIVIFGHTHMPYCEKLDDIWFINPGSPNYPRLTRQGSYAVIESSVNNIEVRIIYI